MSVACLFCAGSARFCPLLRAGVTLSSNHAPEALFAAANLRFWPPALYFGIGWVFSRRRTEGFWRLAELGGVFLRIGVLAAIVDLANALGHLHGLKPHISRICVSERGAGGIFSSRIFL